jgi:hypothetical protein
MEPLGWDEIVSQPGMGGYLSFLNGPVALPHLAQGTPAPPATPGVESTKPQTATTPVIAPATGPAAVVATPEPASTPRSVISPAIETTPGAEPIPAAGPGRAPESTTGVEPTPTAASASAGAALAPGVNSVPRRPRIRRCLAAQDGHSLGEEVLYQALWKAAQPESGETRTITVGWRGMSQLCRMTPKNCKINTQRLLRKLALEILSPYNTPESIGTTYRVFSGDAIVRRRHDAGFEWVIRSRGVEFVNPATGTLLPTCAVTS